MDFANGFGDSSDDLMENARIVSPYGDGETQAFPADPWANFQYALPEGPSQYKHRASRQRPTIGGSRSPSEPIPTPRERMVTSSKISTPHRDGMVNRGHASRYEYSSDQRCDDVHVIFTDPSDGVGISVEKRSQQDLLRQKVREDTSRRSLQHSTSAQSMYRKRSENKGAFPSFPQVAPSKEKALRGQRPSKHTRDHISRHTSPKSSVEITSESTNAETDGLNLNWAFSRVQVRANSETESTTVWLNTDHRQDLEGEDIWLQEEHAFPLLSTGASSRFSGPSGKDGLRKRTDKKLNRVRFAEPIQKPRSVPFLKTVSRETIREESSDPRSKKITHSDNRAWFVAQPKSILRRRRFAGETVSHDPQYPQKNRPSSHRAAPQRKSATSFLDTQGSLLSPIHSDRRPWDRISETGSESLSPSYSDVEREKRVSLGPYHLQELNEMYPDPPLELQFDDESTVVPARASFIDTVAAVVVQAAVRRFLAQKVMHEMVGKAYSFPHLESDDKKYRPLSSRKVTPEKRSSRKSYAESPYGRNLGGAVFIEVMAAIKIQSAFRGFWVRDSLNVDHFCATMIQKWYRRHHQRHHYFADLSRIILVQSIWRRSIAREHAAFFLGSVITVQSLFRSYSARKKLYSGLTCLRKDTMAAVVIQSQWRTYACECNFIRDLVDILIVQSVVRTWLARRHLSSLRSRAQSISGKKSPTVSKKYANQVAAQPTGSPRPGEANRNSATGQCYSSYRSVEESSFSAILGNIKSKENNHLIVLITSQSLSRNQASTRSNIGTILRVHNVSFEEVDGANPLTRGRRDELFAISQMRGVYPQFFVVDYETGLTLFFCNSDSFFGANEEGSLPRILNIAGVVQSAIGGHQERNSTIDEAPKANKHLFEPKRQSSHTTVSIDSETSEPSVGRNSLLSMWKNLDKKNTLVLNGHRN
jgi:hypothetical protein